MADDDDGSCNRLMTSSTGEDVGTSKLLLWLLPPLRFDGMFRCSGDIGGGGDEMVVSFVTVRLWWLVEGCDSVTIIASSSIIIIIIISPYIPDVVVVVTVDSVWSVGSLWFGGWFVPFCWDGEERLLGDPDSSWSPPSVIETVWFSKSVRLLLFLVRLESVDDMVVSSCSLDAVGVVGGDDARANEDSNVSTWSTSKLPCAAFLSLNHGLRAALRVLVVVVVVDPSAWSLWLLVLVVLLLLRTDSPHFFILLGHTCVCVCVCDSLDRSLWICTDDTILLLWL